MKITNQHVNLYFLFISLFIWARGHLVAIKVEFYSLFSFVSAFELKKTEKIIIFSFLFWSKNIFIIRLYIRIEVNLNGKLTFQSTFIQLQDIHRRKFQRISHFLTLFVQSNIIYETTQTPNAEIPKINSVFKFCKIEKYFTLNVMSEIIDTNK